jgi:hypothetical protein
VRLSLFDQPKRRARFALAFLLAGIACSALRHNPPEDETDVITITIVNNNLLNVTVFNVASGHRDRLGEVTAAASSSFKLHLRRLPANEIQLTADPIGSPRPVTSELVRVSPGDVVQWVLESDLARSHIVIR